MACSMRAEDISTGRYTLWSVLILSLNFIVVGFSHAMGIFARYVPDIFYCTWKPENHGCLPGCRNYTFSPNSSELVTVATQFQMVCDRKALLATTSEVYLGGMLAGALIGGLIVDKVGRMFYSMACLTMVVVIGIAMLLTFVPGLYMYQRFAMGFFVEGLELSTYVLGMEMVPKRFRKRVSTGLLTARSFGLCLMALIDSSLLNWRGDYMVTAIFSAISGIFLVCTVNESPRYYYTIDDVVRADLIVNVHKIKNAIEGRTEPIIPAGARVIRRALPTNTRAGSPVDPETGSPVSIAAAAAIAGGQTNQSANGAEASNGSMPKRGWWRPEKFARAPRVLFGANVGKRDEDKINDEPSKLSTVSETSSRPSTRDITPDRQGPASMAVMMQYQYPEQEEEIATSGEPSRRGSKGSSGGSSYKTAPSRNSRFSRESSYESSDECRRNSENSGSSSSHSNGTSRVGATVTSASDKLRRMLLRRNLSTDSDSEIEKLSKKRNISADGLAEVCRVTRESSVESNGHTASESNGHTTSESNGHTTNESNGHTTRKQLQEPQPLSSPDSEETCDSTVNQSGYGGRGPLSLDLEQLLPPDAVPQAERQSVTAEFAEQGPMSRNVAAENPTSGMERNAQGELVPADEANRNIANCPNIGLNIIRLVAPGDRFTSKARNYLLWLWFSAALVYHSLTTEYASRLTTSRHWNVALAGVLEIAVCLFMHATLRKKRRVQPLIAAQICAGTACLLLGGFAASPRDRYLVFKTLVVSFGKMSNIAAFYIIRLMTIEVFPTVMRGSGLGLCIFAQMVGAFVAPLIASSAQIAAHLPKVFVGILSIATAYCAAHMPETGDLILRDVISGDVDGFNMNKDSELNDESPAEQVVSSSQQQIDEELQTPTTTVTAATNETQDSPV